jgi:hypothetical protein
MAQDRRSGGKQAARAERLAAALRENLKRRKAQARARAPGAAKIEKKKPNPASDMNGA